MERLKFISRIFRGARPGGRSPAGATLIEVVIAVVVLGFMLASVPPVLLLMTNTEFRHNESRVAEGLTRCQIEYIKSAPYDAATESHPIPEYDTVPVPDPSYEVDVVATPIKIRPQWSDEEGRHVMIHEPLAPGIDEGIQEIRVTVFHVERQLISTRNFKVNR